MIDTTAGRSTDDALDAIADVHRSTLDAQAGFETMVAKAEPQFRPIASAFHALHARHAQALAAMLARAGRTADTDGSFMATVNKAVVSMRAFFDDIDEDVLAQIRDGEESVIDAFNDALAEPLSAGDDETLRAMRAELMELVAQHTQAA